MESFFACLFCIPVMLRCIRCVADDYRRARIGSSGPVGRGAVFAAEKRVRPKSEISALILSVDNLSSSPPSYPWPWFLLGSLQLRKG